jgi:glycosyltransferase involved in cell wall biosynthesis
MTSVARHSTVPTSQREEGNLLVCFSHLRWNFVYQRPQHLLRRAARNYTVIFFEEPNYQPSDVARLDLRRSVENVTIATPIIPTEMSGQAVIETLRSMINRLVRQPHGRLIFWYYAPSALRFSGHIPPDLCVYDNMDELSAFRGAAADVVPLEAELFKRADVVFTGGQSLYEAKKHRHGNIHAIPSSIDSLHFGRARLAGTREPADQIGIPRPRLGFFGVVDERMDLGLVGRLAELRPDWHLIMVGPVVKIDEAELPRRSNVHWLGERSYADLPEYLAGWDVGIMPFAINASTRFISPTKTPEFLAAGLPVISTPITDVVHPYGDRALVEIAETASEFATCAERILKAPRKDWLARVDAHLATTSWDKTWSRMNKLVLKGLLGRGSVGDRSAIMMKGEGVV